MQTKKTTLIISHILFSIILAAIVYLNYSFAIFKLLPLFILCSSLVYILFLKLEIAANSRIDRYLSGEISVIFLVILSAMVLFKSSIVVIIIITTITALAYNSMFKAFFNQKKKTILIPGIIMHCLAATSGYYLFSKNPFDTISTVTRLLSGSLTPFSYSYTSIIIIAVFALLTIIFLTMISPFLLTYSMGKAYSEAARIPFTFMNTAIKAIRAILSSILTITTGIFNSNGLYLVSFFKNDTLILQFLKIATYSQLLLLFYHFFNNVFALIIVFALTYISYIIAKLR